jgi:hypothetical protein
MTMPVTRSWEPGRIDVPVRRDLTRHVYEQATGNDRLHLAAVSCCIYRAHGLDGPRSFTPDLERGTSFTDPSFGDGWVVSVQPDSEHHAALGQHVMFVSDAHLAEDRDLEMGAAAAGLLGFARRVPEAAP